MSWWKRALGLPVEETKAITSDGLDIVSTEHQDNFVRNQVTVADYRDNRAGIGAAGLSATYACVSLLAGTIASLPLLVYRNIGERREIAYDHALYYVLHESPNFDQDAFEFWEYMEAAILLQGNAYAEVNYKANGGGVHSLTPIRPDRVRARRLSDGNIEYEVIETVGSRKLQQRQMLHIRGPLGDALSGSSALAVCRSTFASAAAIDQAAREMFSNGVRPSGILSTDRTLTPDQHTFLSELLEKKYQGAMNAGRPMVLDNGMSWVPLTVNPADAQMLESRRFGVEEICRVFGVPPHMIGHSEKSTSWGTGLEQQTLGFVKFTLRPRIKRIELALEKQLLTPQERRAGMSIEFNLEGLLRGDSAGRAQFYEKMVRTGIMTKNECRALENLPPVEGGDVIMVQMQDQSLIDALRGTNNE